MANEPTLYILDGSYYVFRAFYAIREMSNSRGMPTNALFAFTNMLLNVIRDEHPAYLAVAFDPPGPTFRREIYPEYKANRESPPEELRVQMPYFREIVKALNIPVLEVTGVEADDVIGTIVTGDIRDGVNVVILSGDKDLCQLLDEHTVMFDSMRGRTTDVAAVREKYQVGPEAVADVLGLAGDSSDNIPGVPGIGVKTAGKLLAEFGTVENLLENIDSVSGKKRKENLHTFREQALLSKRLATIKTDVPLDVGLEDITLSAPDFLAFDKLCQKLEFNRFPSQLRELFEGEAGEQALAAADEANYRMIVDPEELDAAVAAIRAKGRFAFDLETTGLDPATAEIVGFALAWEPGEAVYVPVAHVSKDEQLDRELVIEKLRPLLTDPEIGVICQNVKYELRMMRRAGVEIEGVTCDTMLAAYLIDPNKRRYNMDALALEYLGHSTIRFSDVAGSGQTQMTFDEVELDEATPYAAEDADVTLRLAEKMMPLVADGGQSELLQDIELPLAGVISRMEDAGIRLDPELLHEMSAEFGEKIDELEAEIQDAAGEPFKVSSPKQLGAILFDKLGLPPVKKTKTGYSTAQGVLEELKHQHPIPALVLEYRHLAKLKSTYVDSLPKLVSPIDGRVHSSYNQAVAATGRLSSSDPNLQNIPIRSAEGRRIREAFVAEDGWVLCGGDYSQIELRLLAHMSGDPVLLEAFNSGADIHRRTASEIFEVADEEVTVDQRSAAKAINFGLIYGMGANRLANELGIGRGEASAYIERYFDRIPGVKPFLDELVDQARQTGWSETMFGRRRPIPELQSGRGRAMALGERLAMNTPIQGSAADIIKVAMIAIDRRLRAEGLRARLLLQVHDELILEAPESELATVMGLAREEMEGAARLAVPLVVEFHSGASWASLK